MPVLRLLSASEQVAEHLRGELRRGRWTGTMPGEHRLVGELGIGHDTVKLAPRHLEKEGWLVAQGPGKRRRCCGNWSPIRRTAGCWSGSCRRR